uniref:Putative rhipicephalus family xiii n=1 Tax=Rhipicephalus pulchellus TaxID=72859 RepID=L7LY94_RHIPC
MRTLCAISFLALGQYLVFAVVEEPPVAPIGKDVVVNASIFYDSNYAKWHKEKKPKLDIAQDLKHLVSLAQGYFHKQNVTVTFNVSTVENVSNYLVFDTEKSIKGNKTLRNMTKFANSRKAPNNSIYYHFSGYSIDANIAKQPLKKRGLSDTATTGTFCTKPSAAILLYFPGSNNTLAFVHATARTFGVTDHLIFTPKDIEAMNATFAKCSTREKK